MICLDTTFLVDLWRNRRDPTHPALKLLAERKGEVFAVPVVAAGEFLEGAAYISPARLQDGLFFLHQFVSGNLNLDTARHYADIVSYLRQVNQLAGTSKFDLWIAAWSLEHNAELATRNVRHFEHVPELKIIPY